MGMVYLAHDQRLSNRPCAIKEMVDHFIDPQQRLEANEYFAREADTLAQLKHAHAEDAKPGLLQHGEDLAGMPCRHRVRFNDRKSAFHLAHNLL